MQQFSVPQFVEIEDKIFGPFTLKQFLVMVAGGIVVLLIWAVFNVSLVFWLASAPVALITIFIALGHFNGRAVLDHVLPLLSFIKTPKKLIFKRGAPEIVVQKKAPPSTPTALPPTEVQSRLKRLAYILDQKATQEEELTSVLKQAA